MRSSAPAVALVLLMSLGLTSGQHRPSISHHSGVTSFRSSAALTLADEGMVVGTIAVVPHPVVAQHGAVFVAVVVRFAAAPRRIAPVERDATRATLPERSVAAVPPPICFSRDIVGTD